MADCHRTGSKAADGATTQLPAPLRAGRIVVYLVRSFEFILESVSHDWHVQPSCQRPNRGPPERRAFSPGEFYFMWANPQNKSDCPRNPTNIPCGAKPCQRSVATGFPDDFHIRSVPNWAEGRGAKAQKLRATVCVFRSIPRHFRRKPTRKTKN